MPLLRTRILALLLAALAAAPAGGRAWMECAAGTTCTIDAQSANGCCAPAACDLHPAAPPVAPPEGGCVIRVQPPRDAVPAAPPALEGDATPAAVVPEPPVTAPLAPSRATSAAEDSHPPSYLFAKQGLAARPPPRIGV